MSLLNSILSCILGDPIEAPTLATTDPPLASNIVNTILTSPTTADLHKSLNEQVTATGWTDSLVHAILQNLTSAIESGAAMAQPAADALKKARDSAVGFAHDHPVYVTLIALGVLFVLLPWTLEILGFGELGVVEGSWAAGWQAMYRGFVPKRSLFGFFQRLGAKWHWY